MMLNSWEALLGSKKQWGATFIKRTTLANMREICSKAYHIGVGWAWHYAMSTVALRESTPKLERGVELAICCNMMLVNT